MIAHRLLSAADFNSLHDCFLRAFSDYEVDMRMSREQFRQRIVRDGVSFEMSAGAFDGERMVAFYINGLGQWNERTTAYDAGTGVIPEYRGRGLAKELFAFLVPRLKGAGVCQYLLEVLTSNVAAATLYRKLGFVESRRLAVFRSGPQKGTKGTQPVAATGARASIDLRWVEEPEWGLYRLFWDGSPSWQNSIDAVERIGNDRSVIGAYVDDGCVGYGVMFKAAESLMQLAVAREHRRKGIGSAILSALEAQISQPLKINNIDEELKAALAFYEANGYKSVLSQYEMMKTL